MEVAMKLLRLLPLALVLLVGTSMAHAGLYVGASYGDTSIKQEDSSFSFDGSSNTAKVFAGFTFMKFVGIEASYLDMGSAEDEVAPGIDASVDLTGWDLFIVGNLPIGKHFDIFAKAGLVVWDASTSISGISGDESDDGNDPVYGAGFRFKFAKLIGVRLEYERFDIQDTDGVDMASAGIEFRF
jgi:hypothetical protein